MKGHEFLGFKGPFALGDNDTDFWRCTHVVRDGLHCYQYNCSHMMTEKNTSLSPSGNGPLQLKEQITKAVETQKQPSRMC